MKRTLRTLDARGDFVFENRYYIQEQYYPLVTSRKVELSDLPGVHEYEFSRVSLHDLESGTIIGSAAAVAIPVTGWTHDRGINLRTYRRGKTFFLVDEDGSAMDFQDFRDLIRTFNTIEQSHLRMSEQEEQS